MSERPDHSAERAGSEPVGGPADGGKDGADGGKDGGSGSSARGWVVPALLFVAGLLLGGVAVAAAGLGDDGAADLAGSAVSPSPSPSPSPTPEPTGGPEDIVVRIPAPCVQVAEEADAAFEDVDAFAQAVRDFDARRLQEFLDRFQEVRPRIEGLSEQCQSLASEGIVDGELITPTPAATS